MGIRPLILFVAAALAATVAPAQSGNAVLDPSKTSVPTPQPKALSPEDRGDILMAEKKYRDAIDAYREGAAKDPVLLNKTGIAYHQLMQLDNARKYYQQAIRYKSDYMEAINNLGTIYYAKKSYRRAISYYNRAIKVAPDDPRSASVYSNLGTAYFARKDYPDATKAYETALRLDPDVFEHHGNFGSMLEERSIEERAKYHFYIAKLYAKSGRSELAIQYLRKALEEGFKDKKKLEEDSDFASLRDMADFKKLLELQPRVL